MDTTKGTMERIRSADPDGGSTEPTEQDSRVGPRTELQRARTVADPYGRPKMSDSDKRKRRVPPASATPPKWCPRCGCNLNGACVCSKDCPAHKS